MPFLRLDWCLWSVLWAVLMLSIMSCVDQRHDELYAESEELQAIDNAFTDALNITSAEIISGKGPTAHKDGPRLESLKGPVQIVEGRPFTVRLVCALDDAKRVAQAVLSLGFAGKHLRIPVTVDLETGYVHLTFEIPEDSSLVDKLTTGEFILVDKDGRAGNPIAFRFNVVAKAGGPMDLEYQTLFDHQGATRALDFRRGTKHSFMVSGGNDNDVVLWNLETGHEVQRYLGHTAWVLSVVFNKIGTMIVSGAADNTVRFWNTSTGKLLATQGSHLDQVTSVAITPDDSIVASGSWDHTIQFRQLPDGDLIREVDAGERVNAIAFSSSGTHFAAASGRLLHSGRVRLWDTATFTATHDMPDLDREATALTFSAAGDLLAAASGRGTIYIWDVVSGELYRTLGSHVDDVEHKYAPPKDTIPSLDFWPGNDRVLATACLNGVFTLWDIQERRVVVGGPTRTALTAVRFAPAGFRLMLGGNVGLTHLLQVESLEPKQL